MEQQEKRKKWNRKMDAWLLYNTLRNCRNYNAMRLLLATPSCFLMKAWKCSRKTKLCNGTTHIFYAFILDKIQLIFDLSAQFLKELNVLNNFWQNSLNWGFFIFLFQFVPGGNSFSVQLLNVNSLTLSRERSKQQKMVTTKCTYDYCWKMWQCHVILQCLVALL